jgi:hypothetical protein
MSKSIPRAGASRRIPLSRFARTALLSAVISSAIIGAEVQPACAQDAANLYGMQFYVTPYLWLSGINATVKTPLVRAPEVNSSVSVIDLLRHLHGIPIMGAFEVRQGPLGFLGDVLHVPVNTNITTRNVFYQGGSATLKTNMGTGLVVYRLLNTPSQFADLGAGVRAWSFSADLTLNPGELAGQSVNRSAGWGDPLVGGRYHYDFGNGFGLTAYGDVGGFGVGAHADWQVIGTIDYTLNSWINLHLGYRSLNFNYQASDSNLGFNVHMKGPLFAGTFRF